MGAATSKQLEDLYLPHRPKRSTRSTAAQDRGLAPLAQLLLAPDTGLPPHVLAKNFLGKDVKSPCGRPGWGPRHPGRASENPRFFTASFPHELIGVAYRVTSHSRDGLMD